MLDFQKVFSLFNIAKKLILFYYFSIDEVAERQKKTPKKKSPVEKKRKSKAAKPYKIPEDWASDDSDWEYSDEEGNLKTNKRSKCC